MSPLELELAGAVVEALRPIVEELVRDEVGRLLTNESPSGVEWLTVEEYAERRRTTVAAVHQRLRRGQVPGALKDGRRWLLPALPPAITLTSTNGLMARGRMSRLALDTEV
jgi:hypothetical protein